MRISAGKSREHQLLDLQSAAHASVCVHPKEANALAGPVVVEYLWKLGMPTKAPRVP